MYEVEWSATRCAGSLIFMDISALQDGTNTSRNVVHNWPSVREGPSRQNRRFPRPTQPTSLHQQVAGVATLHNLPLDPHEGWFAFSKHPPTAQPTDHTKNIVSSPAPFWRVGGAKIRTREVMGSNLGQKTTCGFPRSHSLTPLPVHGGLMLWVGLQAAVGATNSLVQRQNDTQWL